MRISLIIGALTLRTAIMNLLRAIYYQIRPRSNLLKKYGEGSWAVVTGASDGIGVGFCKELAREGFNICLVSRTLKKMEEV